MESLATETQPILEKARDRLNQAFDLELSLPPNPQLNSNIGKINFQVNSLVKEVTDYKTETYRPWYFLFIVEVERKVAVTRNESCFTVSLKQIVAQINNSIKASINSIDKEIIEYLDEDFKQCIESYFKKLDAYLSNYRDVLKQSQADGELCIKKKDELVSSLKDLIPEAHNKLNTTTEYIERTQHFI